MIKEGIKFLLLIFSINLFFTSVYSNNSKSLNKKFSIYLGEQDWGYVTIKPGVKMFWWLYYVNSSIDNPIYFEDKPLLIWVSNESPTAFANFGQVGPLDEHLKIRNNSWVNHYNVLFIDAVIGTGFSYKLPNKKYDIKSTSKIASHLMRAIKLIFKKFPKFKTVPTFVISEGYGAKLAIKLALRWDSAAEGKHIKSNLKGIALGNPWISPKDTIASIPSYLFYSGSIDSNSYYKLSDISFYATKSIELKKWKNGLFYYRLMLKEINNYVAINDIRKKISVSNETINEYDQLKKSIELIMNNTDLNTILNIENQWNSISNSNIETLDDFFQSTVADVERILNFTNLKVFIYSGQFNVIPSTPSTNKWVNNLNWEGNYNWYMYHQQPIIVNEVIEGSYLSDDHLSLYLIQRAGKMIARDNPQAVLEMLKELTRST